MQFCGATACSYLMQDFWELGIAKTLTLIVRCAVFHLMAAKTIISKKENCLIRFTFSPSQESMKDEMVICLSI